MQAIETKIGEPETVIISRVFQGFYLAGAALLVLKIFVVNDTPLVDPAVGMGVALCLVPILIHPLRALHWMFLKAYQIQHDGGAPYR